MRIQGIDIHDKIGEGTTATVWKGHQATLDRPLAVKVLKHEFASNPAEVRAFLEEARAVAKLKHPAIIGIYDVGESDGTCYFVMEFVQGATLFQVIQKKTTIPWTDAFKIAIPAAEALEHAWTTANITHRGLKPGNLFIDRDSGVKLADFGMSRLLDPLNLSPRIQSRNVTATTNYCSPEQAGCAVRLDFRSDMYSLGAVLYHMLTGRMPFAPATPTDTLEKHRSEQLKSPREMVAGIHRSAEDILVRLMMKAPDERYQSWTEAIAEMKKAALGRSIPGTANLAVRSTIAPAPVSKATPRTDRQPALPALQVPGWFRASAWLLVIVFLVAFGTHEFGKPIPKPTPPPVPRSTAVPQAKAQQHVAAEQPANPVQDAYSTGPVAAAEKPAAVETPVQSGLDLATFSAGIVDSILKDDFKMAAALVEQELQYSHIPEAEKTLEAMQAFLSSATQKDAIIEASLRSQVGKEISLRNGNKTIRMTLEKVQDGVIEGTIPLVTSSGASARQSTTMQISQLPPDEQARLLGSADTPAKAAIKCVLFMRAQKYDSARQFAASSGPLADAFMERIKAQTGK